MGVSGDQKQQYADLTSAGGFATGEGEGDISASDKFFKDILSGDSTKTAQALAPQIGAAKTSAQQQTATDAQFGNRGGGTNASSAAANDRVHSDITGLVGETTGKAASTLGSEGGGLLSTGIGAATTGFDEASKMQQQKEAKFNDIINSSVAVAAAPFTGGASLSGLAGGTPDLTGMSMPGKGGGDGSTPPLDPGFTQTPTGPVQNASVIDPSDIYGINAPPVQYGDFGMGSGPMPTF
jgi:hypothetical protein